MRSGTNSDYSMQAELAHSLGLVFQLDAINYDRTNFLNSDLSIPKFNTSWLKASHPRQRTEPPPTTPPSMSCCK